MTRATRRTVTSFLVWALLLAGVGGLAWLTWHPEARVLDAMAQWPPTRSFVRAFRARYSPHLVAARQAAPSPPPEIVVREDYRVVVPEPIDARPLVWIPSGAKILDRPDDHAAIVHRQHETAGVPFRERRGDWFHVRTAAFEGWVHLPGYDAVSNPPLGSGLRAPKPLPSRPPAPDRLEDGLEMFSSPARSLQWGEYLIHTDLADGPLLAECRQIAQHIQAEYEQRYRLSIDGSAREQVLLFSQRGDYERFQQQDARVAGLPAAGHSGPGLVALHAEARSSDEVVSTFVHELTHLLNRRAIGPALPPWLEEGIADDLGLSVWSDQGGLEFDSFSGWRRERPNAVELGGGLAALEMTRQGARSGRLMPMQQLLALDWDEFVRSSDRQQHYAQAFLFVRYLMATATRRDAFLAYLKTIAAGGSVDAEHLRQQLGMSWSDVQHEYVTWLLSSSASPARRAGS